MKITQILNLVTKLFQFTNQSGRAIGVRPHQAPGFAGAGLHRNAHETTFD